MTKGELVLSFVTALLVALAIGAFSSVLLLIVVLTWRAIL